METDAGRWTRRACPAPGSRAAFAVRRGRRGLLAALGAALLLAACARQGAPERATTEGGRGSEKKAKRKIKYWVAPMNPSYHSDKPGKSPMGMDLVPVYEDEGSTAGEVKIDPVVMQDIGVRIAPVERRDLWRRVRTVGTVMPAEDELSVVNLRFSGWIERLYVDQTGVLVKRGQPLFEVYSPELVSAEQEYLVALRTGVGSALARSARERLRLFGLGAEQIARVERSRVPRSEIVVSSPRAGYVLHKSVVEGDYVKAGTDVFRVADLSKVWIEGEVYEVDAPFVALGAPATAKLTFEPGVTYHGVVSFIRPTLDPRTRTLRVRIELPNPRLALKPDSFATVDIEAQRLKDVLVVPNEAVIRTGTREVAFVVRGLGEYELRDVVTGVQGEDDLTEIRSGLKEGERVVTSGEFLLDSESQLQEAAEKMSGQGLQSNEAGGR
jgi:multidrug efflux pump subunit AcrA (membrane-fusion protein)